MFDLDFPVDVISKIKRILFDQFNLRCPPSEAFHG